MKTVYTLGHTSSYDEAIYDDVGTTKLGRRDVSEEFPEGYGGGWIWIDPAEADRFRTSAEFAKAFPDRDPGTFSVYRLDLQGDLDSDVTREPADDGVRRLLIDAKIVCKETGL